MIAGDFNTRLVERLPGEETHIGPFIYSDGIKNIEMLSPKQLENRIMFMDFIQEHNFIAQNTWFEKPMPSLATYRRLDVPSFTDEVDLNKFAQMDFILINNKWKNSVKDVYTTLDQPILSDHKLLICCMTQKLAQSKKNTKQSSKYRTPDDDQKKHYNERIMEYFMKAEGRVNERDGESEDPFIALAKTLLDAAHTALTPVPEQQKKPYISEQSWDLIQRKEEAIKNGDTDEAKQLTKQVRQQVRKDKQQLIIEELEEVEREGYKWTGLKRLRKTYTPNFTRFKDKHGKLVTEKQYVEHAADYLEHEQWKKHETTERRADGFEDSAQYKIKDTEITLDELNEVISTLKCNKAAGPDMITTELIKWCNMEVRQHLTLLSIYNKMFTQNIYYDSLNKANIASICKKGNPAKLENYRPIALLQISTRYMRQSLNVGL